MNLLRRSVRVRVAERLRRSVTHLIALAVALAVALPVIAATSAPASAAPADGVLKVLLFYKTQFHASQAQARVAVKELAAQLGTQYSQTVDIQETDDAAVFNTANLETKDVVVFAQTGGVLFNAEQRSALESYIRAGGGYVGMHYAAWSVGQSEHDVNPFYARLVGAASEGHPEDGRPVRPGRVVVKDTASPLTQGLPAEITRSDEWYDWVVNPAQNVRTLVEADEASYADSNTGGRQGTTHPITWCQQGASADLGAGRSWYTGMGHEGSAFSETFIRTQLKNGMAYSAGLVAADCTPPVKENTGSWSGVTPWPLMPINAALTSDGRVQSFGSISSGCTDATPYDWTGNDCVTQGGQTETDVWNPAIPRTLANLRNSIVPNSTYTDLFCSMQVQNPHTRATMTVGGDDGLGGNAPNDAAIGVTSYTTNRGLRTEAPMNYPRWYPTGSTMPNGDIVVQGGSLRGGPGGPGVITPEVYTPDAGTSWKLLTGATSAAAYGDGGGGNGPDENRWWYPRAFVAPENGNLFNISGTQMFELDPEGNGGTGATTLRGNVPAASANQGVLGNPVGATSTATMYRPGKILQVGGGTWSNGGGANGARAGLTVDLTTAGGTANPVVAPTQPMKYQRHWATSTVLPDGDVLVTGGGRENNGRDDTVTNAEIWNPTTGQWTVVEVPHERARLYHSMALLLPDGRIMMGGGGGPGPRNYTDVEYYSPSYLFDGNAPAVRPTITSAPKKIGYNGTFNMSTASNVSRVTLVRNGSVTHGFNNDQNFQDLAFTKTGANLTITAPKDATYAPPGTYMVFVFDENGTPSVASMMDIDPVVAMDQRTPELVDQFEYPRFPANPPAIIDVAPGNGRMAPWTIDSQVQLVRSTGASQGGLGIVGYHLGLGDSGSLERSITGLDPGRDYRISMKYARDSRSTGTGAATANLDVGDLDATLTATTANPSQSGGALTFASFVDTFTASARSETLALSAPGGAAGMMIDDLVVTAVDPGVSDVPVHYEFEEATGTSAANTGTDASVGAATLTGTTGRSEAGIFGRAANLPGGSNVNAVDLPDNLLQNATDFTTSFWARPDTKGNWINLFHIGDGLGDGAGASFFQIQMQTQAAGNTGLAATFKGKGTTGAASQERVYAIPTRDVTANQWNHVAFTRTGSTGTLYLNGQQIAQKTNFTIGMTNVGPTTNNWLGRNGFPDPAFDGLMDDVRLYRSSLAATDIASLYADGSAKRTTTTVSVDPVSPSAFAEPLTVSTTVKDEAAASATGDVELWIDDARVGEPVALAAGAASFPDVTLNPGVHEIEVRYLAGDGFRDSLASVTHTVSRPPPGEGVPIRYTFNEGSGTTAANTGSDPSVGAATLGGTTSFTPNGQFGAGVSLPGGGGASGNQVNLPNNIEEGMDEEFSVSVWARPNALPNWVPLLQIGSSTDTFFLLQSSTQAAGATGFAATFKAPGNPTQERLTLGAGNDLPLNAWTHVVFTMSGSTGRIYFDGELQKEGPFTLGIGDVGVGGNTTANSIGGTSWNDPRFNGLIDEFQMFGYELTEEQVEDLAVEAPANVAPAAVNDAYSTGEGDPLTVQAPGVLGNDTDSDAADTLEAIDASEPADGAVTLNEDGSFTYTPDGGFVGTDTFTYRASDGALNSNSATVTITVTQDPNVAPAAVNDAYSTDEGDPLAVQAPGVLANDTDVDDDMLTAVDATQPANGAVTLNVNGSFTYTPVDGFAGTDTFTYRARDGALSSGSATVTITVNEVEEPPAPPAPPAVTAISGSSAAFTYGQSGVVTATITPASAAGNVEVRDGSMILASGTVTAGRATLALPARSLAPGTRQLTLSYVGNSSFAASSGAVAVTVQQVTPRMTVKPKQVRRGDRVKVKLSAANDVPVTGKVTVKLKGGSKVTGRVKNATMAFTIPGNAKLGGQKMKFTYSGSDLAIKVKDTVRVRVRR